MQDRNLSIAIIGGSGRAGRPLIDAALESGLSVRALARRPERFPKNRAGLELVEGDARDPAAIAALLEGCDRVIITLGAPRGEAPSYESASRNLIAAMRARGIGRCVLLVGLGIDAPGDRKSLGTRAQGALMRLMLRSAMNDKQRGVEAVMASGLEWTIVRSPLIEEGPPLGGTRVGLKDAQGKSIRAADLASFVLDAATEGKFIRASPFVAGPR